MSTISDALKKAQKNREGNTPGAAPLHPRESPKIPAPSPPVSSSRSSRIGIIAAVLSLCLAYLILQDFRHPNTLRSTMAAPKAPEVPETPPPIASPEEVPSKATPSSPALIPPTDLPALAGIFYATQNPVAILNGAALKEGETAGTYRVVKILPYSVKVESSVGEFEIKLK